jgi:hypothetical protein
MLLEFAAQAKSRSQRSLARTAITISRAPTEVKHLLVQFKYELVALISHLQDSLTAMRERRQAKAKEKRKLEQTEKRLKAATELLKKNDSLIAKMDGSSQAQTEVQEAQQTESKEKLDEINTQIAKLREQMELFARLQAMTANNGETTGNSAQNQTISAADIPIAPSLDASPVDVPSAPPLGDFSLSSASHPKLAVEIPLAPPFSPTSKPNLKSHNRQNSLLIAPTEVSYRRSVEPASHSQPSSFTPSHNRQSSNQTPLNDITTAGSPRSIRSPIMRKSGQTVFQSTPQSNLQFSSGEKPNIKIFTRKIPGEANLSHNDLIRVAAAVKLRKTPIPRSPGGTPARTRSHMNDPFAEALFQKFRLANRRSDNFERKSSNLTAPPTVVEDKENWETN